MLLVSTSIAICLACSASSPGNMMSNLFRVATNFTQIVARLILFGHSSLGAVIHGGLESFRSELSAHSQPWGTRDEAMSNRCN